MTPAGRIGAKTWPYNHVLTTPALCEHADSVFVIDNAGISALCNRHFQIVRPTYDAMNRIIAQAVSSLTMSERLPPRDIRLHCGISTTELWAFPRMHFWSVSYSPIFGTTQWRQSRLVATHCLQRYAGNDHSTNTVTAPYLQNMSYMRHRILSYIARPPVPPRSLTKITETVFQPGNMLGSYDVMRGKFMYTRLVYRGDIDCKEVHAAVFNLKMDVKAKRSIQFVDWMPSTIKFGMR